MIRCYITDRNLRGLHNAVRQKVEWIQVRDKELSARALMHLTSQVSATAPATKVIVNSRMDVAIVAGAAGLHLPSNSAPASSYRAIAPAGFLIGVSCHATDEVRRAEQEGADYVVFGPVFAPLSKTSHFPPCGLGQLEQAALAVKIPVLALGGITLENSQACIEAGARGIAAISLFETC
jgi:thiamine-phosphate pyrophosphorylase